jgi:hypothetical protein
MLLNLGTRTPSFCGCHTEIIGLVQNVKYSEVKNAVPPLFFRPFRQEEMIGFLTFYVRTALVPEPLMPQLAKVVARLYPNLPVEILRTEPRRWIQCRLCVTSDRLGIGPRGFSGQYWKWGGKSS